MDWFLYDRGLRHERVIKVSLNLSLFNFVLLTDLYSRQCIDNKAMYSRREHMKIAEYSLLLGPFLNTFKIPNL